MIIALFAGLLVAALAVVGLIWQRRRRLAYQALYQAALETQALRSHFEYLVKYANDIIILVDEKQHVVEVNDRALEAYGYTRQEMLGLPLAALIPRGDLPSYQTRLRKIQQKGAIVAEAIHQRKDGSTFPVEVSGRAIKIEDKTYLQEIVRDITERKRAEETLRQSEEKYRTIINEIYGVFYELDLAGNYTFFNDALCRQTGYSRKELMGMNYRTYIPEEDWRSVYEKFNRIYRTGEPMRRIPFRNITKDGRILYIEDTVLPLRNESGEVIGFRGLGRDITERKKAEEERIQMEIKAQITSRLASVGEMAAGVAHEINNPLTAVTGYAQLLVGREDIPPDIRSDLEAINDGARRVAGIVRTLLAFSRQTKPQRKLVDINELIESTLTLRAYHLRVNNIEVVTRLAPDLPETVADPGQIQQVLLNLIVNAEMEMKLAHGKGKLTITTKKSNNTIKICCQDNGPGIMPEVMDRIFDPFFTTRETGQGTGLGLSLCYGIVTEHKGKIYAESKPGKGATFIVELPVITEAKPPKPAEPDVKKPQKAGTARIMVVDDEQVVRDVVNRVLTGEGYKVEAVDNAADALKKIESKRYKLILVDIKMPGMNGVELYKRIQKINKSLARRVVFITGDTLGADTEKFLSEAKVAHIDKPFDAEQLNREVRRVLTTGR
jgi:PAS domain S-box-containing protein